MEISDKFIQIRDPEPVKYIIAITYSSSKILNLTKAAFETQFSEIDFQSQSFNFNYTTYYEKEMGANLNKQFFSFKDLCNKDNLVNWKLYSLEIEYKYAHEIRRQVNIDPSYLELAKLVVASTKNFDHRIYLGQGIYGDVQLRYRNRQYITNDWTYPDYRSPEIIKFIKKVRNIYSNQFKQMK